MKRERAPHDDPQLMASELASEAFCDEVLAGDGSLLQIDNLGSVSAMHRAELPVYPTEEELRSILKGGLCGTS